MNPPFTPLAPEDPPEIGGYRLVARLGAGGMGQVFLASTQSGRRLAVKVMLDSGQNGIYQACVDNTKYINYHRLKPGVCSHGPVWLRGGR
ncbi:hypothetical protein [Nonomuraea sp. NPDC049750]|uniref:hypothetical protein n=1 Tax=Nonomuraea sp. NPDC049750 TaxID=3154738 RepID=UPI0033F60517